MQTLGSYAFQNCVELTAIEIPGNVKTIDTYCFQGCKRLETVTFNEGLQTIKGGAFAGCPITSATIPNSVVAIEEVYYYGWNGDNYDNYVGAFEDCTQLKTVTIGNSLESIARETFQNCTALTKVVIGDRVQTIGTYAFAGCSELVDVTIGKSVQTIEAYAFANCSSLPSITIGTGVQTLGSHAFQNCVELTAIEIPGNVKTIDIYCFTGCKRLETVTFNEGLQTIKGGAFAGCPITSVAIPNSVVAVEEYYYYQWNGDNYENYVGAFEDCTQLKTVIIGNSLEIIARETFRGCTSLTDVTIGERVETIGAYAFANCTALEYIYIPANVTSYDDHAFDGCIYLDNIVIGTGVNSVGSYAFARCTALTSIIIPNNVITIGNNVFNNCTALEDVTIEKSKELVRSIGSNVFNGCSNLDRIYYTGTSEEWAEITINGNNVYPLSVTPYFYSSSQPTASGNYWYYNASDAKRIWDVSEDAYRAEEYSENFVEIFGDESSSYATTFYNDLQNDTTLMLGIQAWELIHITAEPTYIFDPNNSLISKKDLYKLTLYDIMTGEDAETKAAFFEFFDQSSTKFMLYVGNMYLGDPTDAPIDIDMLYQVLHNKDATAIQTVLEKAMSPTDIECAMAIISFAENAYEALESVSQYVALRQIKSGYVDVLMAIYNDTSNPYDLRNAALELVDWYQEACDLTLAEFQMKTFFKATNEDIYSWTLDKIVDVAIDSDTTGILKAVNFTGKAIRAIAEPLKLDDFCKAYYQLKTSVGVESALRKLIQVTIPDYMRYENQGTSETYMCTVELYENSVLCGFDYSIDLLTAYVNSSNPDEEGMEDYRNLVATLNSYKDQKQNSYNTFDNAVLQKYEVYYS